MTVDDSGAQPSITASLMSADKKRYSVSITTSADQKSIVRLTATISTYQDVNAGTLLNPVPVKSWVADPGSTVECTK